MSVSRKAERLLRLHEGLWPMELLGIFLEVYVYIRLHVNLMF